MPKVRLKVRPAETTGPAHHRPNIKSYFLESEEEFAMDQTPATGSVTPFPEPCGLGGEVVAFLGQHQQPEDR